MIARKVQKYPLSPVVTSNVVLSGLARLADILARLVQMADSLSALQLTGALFTINWGTLCQAHLPPHSPLPLPPASAPPPPPHLLDRSAAPAWSGKIRSEPDYITQPSPVILNLIR